VGIIVPEAEALREDLHAPAVFAAGTKQIRIHVE
jgi:hypothetical protein